MEKLIHYFQIYTQYINKLITKYCNKISFLYTKQASIQSMYKLLIDEKQEAINELEIKLEKLRSLNEQMEKTIYSLQINCSSAESNINALEEFLVHR